MWRVLAEGYTPIYWYKVLQQQQSYVSLSCVHGTHSRIPTSKIRVATAQIENTICPNRAQQHRTALAHAPPPPGPKASCRLVKGSNSSEVSRLLPEGTWECAQGFRVFIARLGCGSWTSREAGLGDFRGDGGLVGRLRNQLQAAQTAKVDGLFRTCTSACTCMYIRIPDTCVRKSKKFLV